jgi:nitrogen fixation protein NifU and related proteins
MSEFDQLYREVILDHYKNPRGHGVIAEADAEAEGQNPLCGDEVSIYVRFGEDSDTIDEVKFSGRGCAIRLKCAMLGLTTLKVALHKAKGTPLPEGLAGYDELSLS